MIKEIKFLLLLRKVKKEFDKRVKKSSITAVGYGLVTAVGASLVAAFTTACPGLTENWPMILLSALTAGFGKWMHSGKSAEVTAPKP